uniref:CNH domain-containing protein n=1 Tax=Acrobeloides nanus TaxID=290746 RepID=A0A914ED52_9BILA
MKRDESNFFAPYKSLGEVCSEIPPVYQHVPYRKDQGFVCCAIGNAVCAYTIQPFRLRHISNTLPDKITILARDKTHLFAAFGGNKIAMLRHNRMILKYINVRVHPKFLLSFGEILVVIDLKNSVHVIDIEENETILKIDGTSQFDVTAVVHPLTYMNKVLLI